MKNVFLTSLVALLVATPGLNPAFAGNFGSNKTDVEAAGNQAFKDAKTKAQKAGSSLARSERLGNKARAKAEAAARQANEDQRNGNLGVWIDNAGK